MYNSSAISKFRIIIPALLVAAGLWGCGGPREASRDKGKDEAIPVKVERVRLEELDKVLEYIGDIKAQDEAVVYPKVSGKIIEKVREEGARVAKGDVIAFIDRDEVGLKFEKAPIESPLAGFVGRVYVDIGSNVTTQTAVAFIVNMDKMKINLDMPEAYLPRISLGQDAQVTVDAYPDKVFEGKVSKISPVLDMSTRTAPIEITIDNPDYLLKSGMFARVRLVIEEHKDIPVVFKEALIGREPNLYVYVVEDRKASRRKVSLDIRQDALVGIKEGVREGDLVVILGQQKLYDGASVSVEE